MDSLPSLRSCFASSQKRLAFVTLAFAFPLSFVAFALPTASFVTFPSTFSVTLVTAFPSVRMLPHTYVEHEDGSNLRI